MLQLFRRFGAMPSRDRGSTSAAPSGASDPTLCYGFVTDGLEAAYADACRRFGLAPLDEPQRSPSLKSCGGRVARAEGEVAWLKVCGVPSGHNSTMRTREHAARLLSGVRAPRVLASNDWSANGIDWRACVMEWADSSTLLEVMRRRGDLGVVGDDWIAALKSTLDRLAAVPTDHVYRSSDYVAGGILSRFGPDAPRLADEWRTAHGDLNLANLTAPELKLLDWETWGLMPCGYDAAYLVANSALDPAFMRRLELAFADLFESASGRVALLIACAEVLNELERRAEPRDGRRHVQSLARRALERRVARDSTAL